MSLLLRCHIIIIFLSMVFQLAWSQIPSSQVLSSTVSLVGGELWSENWDGRQVDILGIDRTEFPQVMVVFSLRDPSGYPINTIDDAALTVTEDEAPQPITALSRCRPGRLSGEPIAIVVMIDSSGSMQRYIDSVQAAASRFVGQFREEDLGAVVAFCNQPVLLQSLTNKTQKLDKAIYKIIPRGFTALYDSTYFAVKTLANIPGRKAIVLLTDGKDDDGTGVQLSRNSLSDVTQMARKNKIPIFTLGLGEDADRGVLQQLAQETGGDFLYAPGGNEVDGLYQEVARRIGRGDEGYYKLTYKSTRNEPDGTNRTIIIKYNGAVGMAQYPAPSKLFWPLNRAVY